MPVKIDWSGVDWTQTNATIAASLGGIRHETVARARVRRGAPKVYPKFLPRIAALEEQLVDAEKKLRRARELARRVVGILEHHRCEQGLTPGELLILTMASNELREVEHVS